MFTVNICSNVHIIGGVLNLERSQINLAEIYHNHYTCILTEMAALQISIPSGCSVLITGASGLLGRSIYDVFQKSGKWGDSAIMGTAFSRCFSHLTNFISGLV